MRPGGLARPQAALLRRFREREQHEPVLQVLAHCLGELSPADQELIGRRYAGGIRAEELVGQFATSRRTLFRKLDRIRRVLFECISRRVEAAALP